MTDEKLNVFYQQITDTVIEMIPVKWTLVKLYAEMWDDFSTIYFYYFPDNGAEPVLSLSISRLFEVDRDEYTRLKRRLRKQIEQLQDVFMANGQELWTNFTFILHSDGEFTIDYSYEDLSDLDPVEKRERWEARHIQ